MANMCSGGIKRTIQDCESYLYVSCVHMGERRLVCVSEIILPFFFFFVRMPLFVCRRVMVSTCPVDSSSVYSENRSSVTIYNITMRSYKTSSFLEVKFDHFI